jgi:hypothetical protein
METPAALNLQREVIAGLGTIVLAIVKKFVFKKLTNEPVPKP